MKLDLNTQMTDESSEIVLYLTVTTGLSLNENTIKVAQQKTLRAKKESRNQNVFFNIKGFY